MKRVIKCNTISNSDIRDGYREELKYGYVIKKINGNLSINKPRPYDDAEYYWAKYDERTESWKIIYDGKVINRLFNSDYDLEDVLDELEMLNSSIKPRMVHN